MDGIKACCFGRLGGDPEKRYLASGTALLSFSIAVEDGKKADDAPTEWLKVTCWGERAEELAPADGAARLRKGDTVYVEGRLRLNTWAGKDGQQRSGLEMSAWTVTQIGAFRKPGEQRDGSGQKAARIAPTGQDEAPW